MHDLFTSNAAQIVTAGFFVGTIVGVTGMGGGALMTPALIFLGVGNASAIVTADLTAAAVYKTGGALVHTRQGSPNFRLAGWLAAGSVPMALLGPHLVHWFVNEKDVDSLLKECIGFALLLAAATYAIRLWIQLVRVRSGALAATDEEPVILPVRTLLVGALGGLLVGVTSVGSGSVIMVTLLILYPTLSPLKLVGTDLVQAVPLVLAAAISNISVNGLEWSLTLPLIVGSVPGTLIGSQFASKVPLSYIRRGIVIVLTMSGIALLDKAGWAPLGSGDKQTHPVLIAMIGLGMLVGLPIIWGLLRKTQGMPMFGAPTVAEIESGTVGSSTGR